MIRSMTGFGSATLSNDIGEFGAEVKSLNNRFLDLSLRLPRELNFLEPVLRDDVKRRVRRGKVDLFLKWTPSPGAQPLYEINMHVLRQYAHQLRDGLSDLGMQPDVGALLTLPGVVNPTRIATEDGALAALARDVVRQALDGLDNSRKAEGHSLIEAILGHLQALEDNRAHVMAEKDALLADYSARLKDRIEVLGKTLDATLDPTRVETEIMFFADKSDITEELVRLEVHINAFRKLAAQEDGEPVGKPMDFLVQELLREVNTIGNKARGALVASRIVHMKSEIEKVREQVQNLE